MQLIVKTKVENLEADGWEYAGDLHYQMAVSEEEAYHLDEGGIGRLTLSIEEETEDYRESIKFVDIVDDDDACLDYLVDPVQITINHAKRRIEFRSRETRKNSSGYWHKHIRAVISEWATDYETGAEIESSRDCRVEWEH